MRNYEKREKRKRIYNQIFEQFAKVFEYGISFLLLIFVQIIITRKFLNHLKIEEFERFIPYIFDALTASSAFAYACSYVACRSYNARKRLQVNGPSKYKERAIRSFVLGFCFLYYPIGYSYIFALNNFIKKHP